MKTNPVSILLFFVLSTGALSAQTPKTQTADPQKEISLVTKKISRLEKDKEKFSAQLAKQKTDQEEAIKKAEEATKTVTELTQKQIDNPGDPELDKQVKKAKAESDKLSKASSRTDTYIKRLEKNIETADQKIKVEQDKLATLNGNFSDNKGSIASAGKDSTSNKQARTTLAPPPPPVEAPDGQARTTLAPPPPPVEAKQHEETVAKVIEQSYKNLPAQATGGQAPIIINNIIIPPSDGGGYWKSAPSVPQQSYVAPPSPQPVNVPTVPPSNYSSQLSPDDLREYEEFKRWKANKNSNFSQAQPMSLTNYGQPRNGYPRRSFNNYDDDRDFNYDDNRPRKRNESLNDRRKNSGVWIVPQVGVHGSDFKVDFSEDEASGQAGWNAGIDFRVHANRFFIQPGVHYFNSSVDVVSKDTLSTNNFTDGPRIHSLKVPLLVGLYLTRATQSFFKFNIKGGVVGNYLIDVDKNDLPAFTKRNMEEYSYGLNGGIGLEFGPIVIDLSHEWGMSNMFKTGDQKNNILRATLGVRF